MAACIRRRHRRLESFRKVYAGLQSLGSMSRTEAQRTDASALRDKHSTSFARRRHQPSQANVRSRTQRLGSTLNLGSDRLTISTSRPPDLLCSIAELRFLISSVSKQLQQQRIPIKQCLKRQKSAIPTLNIGRVDHGTHQQAYRVDHDMPLLPLGLLPRVVPVRINAGPLFQRFSGFGYR
jgi:hypothetical protein